MPTVQITAGGPDIQDGSYPLQLVKVTGPRMFIPEQGQNAGKEVYVYDWTWRTRNHKGEAIELEETSSTATGPRSKLFEWVTALRNGVAPAVNEAINLDEYVGRLTLGQIQRDPPQTGWPKIVQMMALPPAMQQQIFGQATGAPVQPAPAPQAAPQAPAAPQAAPTPISAAPSAQAAPAADTGTSDPLFVMPPADPALQTPTAPARPVDDLPF